MKYKNSCHFMPTSLKTKSKRDNSRDVRRTDDPNYLDDKRFDYMSTTLNHGSAWMFAQRSMIEAVTVYAEIMGLRSSDEHTRVMNYLFGKTE